MTNKIQRDGHHRDGTESQTNKIIQRDDGHRDVAITRDGGITLFTLDGDATVASEHAVDLEGAPRAAAFVDGRLVVAAGDRVVLLHGP